MSKHPKRRMAELDIESVSFPVFQYNAPTPSKNLCLSAFSKADTVTFSTFRSLSICLTLVFPESVAVCPTHL